MRFFAPKKPTLSGVSEVDRARIEDLAAALDDKPQDLRLRRQLGDAYRAAAQIDAAVEQYQALVGAYAAQGLLFKAIAACKLILELKPDDDETSHTLAQLYARRTAGKESADLSGPMSAALVSGEGAAIVVSEGAVVDESDIIGEPALPPPLPEDADEEILDVSALAAALTPLPEGAVRLERPPAVPLFSGLSQASFASLVKKLSAWEADAGAVVVGEGEESDSVFVVVRGRVRVERSAGSAGGIVLAVLGPDSFFGEMALLSKRPRAATVIAEVKTELLEIPRSVLEDIVSGDPAVAQALDHFSRTRLLANLSRTSPLLKELPKGVVDGAVAAFGKKTAATGTALVSEGDESPGLFVVLAGELDVTAKGELGTVRIKRLEAGDVFGEMSLVSGGKATATVTAASDCTLLFLERSAFASFATANPVLEERLQHLAAAREAFNARFLVPDETSSAVLV
jgi:cAMP-dependent protein kinase regulator